MNAMFHRGKRRERFSSRRLGQGAVETALILPIFLVVITGTIDVGRAIYGAVVIENSVQAAVRSIALSDNKSSDCAALNAAVISTGGLNISGDPRSVQGDVAPAGTLPTGWTSNHAYLYLYPAVATGSPPTSLNCTGSTSRSSGTVTAQITYAYSPWTPLIAQIVPAIQFTATASRNTEY